MTILQIAGSLPVKDGLSQQPFIKSQIDSLENRGIKNELLNLEGHKSSFNYIRGIKKIRRVIKSKNIDVIHAHYVYCGLSALLALTGKPIVLSLMGSDLLGSTNKDGNVTARGKVDGYLSKLVSKYVDNVIVKTNQMKSNLIRILM